MKKLLALALLALPLVHIPPADAAVPTREFVLSRGHLDAFDLTYADGALQMHVKDDSGLYSETTAFRTPGSVTIDADSQVAGIPIPEDLPPDYAFLGPAGTTIYLIPEVQEDDLPWPGWSTERLEAGLPAGTQLEGSAPVQLALSVDGPGAVHTWMSGSSGEVISHFVDTTDDVADVIPVGPHSHVHTNWSFSEAGDYLVTVTPSAKTTTGTLTGPAEVYHFHIGDPLAPFTPVNTSLPEIHGTPTLGATLFASQGAWSPNPTEYLGNQWLRDGVAIDGATDWVYTVTEADLGHTLTHQLTGRIGRESTTATSPGFDVPLGAAPQPTTAPSVSGTVRTGRTVSASPGVWNTTGLTFGYQWLRDGKPISGATARSRKLTTADFAHRVSVRVTARRTGRVDGHATTSAPKVAAGVLTTVTAPTLTGRAQAGRTLQVRPGRWSPAASSVTYRWKAGTTSIATTRSYLPLRAAYVGKRITVTVTAKAYGYAARTYTLRSGAVTR